MFITTHIINHTPIVFAQLSQLNVALNAQIKFLSSNVLRRFGLLAMAKFHQNFNILKL